MGAEGLLLRRFLQKIGASMDSGNLGGPEPTCEDTGGPCSVPKGRKTLASCSLSHTYCHKLRLLKNKNLCFHKKEGKWQMDLFQRNNF